MQEIVPVIFVNQRKSPTPLAASTQSRRESAVMISLLLSWIDYKQRGLQSKLPYRYIRIYVGIIPTITTANLRHKGKRRKAEKRGKFSMGTPIAHRPKEVRDRKTFGHWELDSIVSSRGASKGWYVIYQKQTKGYLTAVPR